MIQHDQDKLERRLTNSKQAVFITGFLLFAFSVLDLWLYASSKIAHGKYLDGLIDEDSFFATLDDIDSAQGIRVTLRIAFIAALVCWTYFSYAFSVDRLGAIREWKKFWTIGGWFIPFAFFFVPLRVIRETERISNGEGKNSVLAPVWWLSSWFAIVMTRTASQDNSENFSASLYFNASIISAGALLVSVAVLRFLVRDVSDGLIEQSASFTVPDSKEESDADPEEPIASSRVSLTDPERIADRIRMISQLHAEGHISTSEFEEKKKDLFRHL